MEIAERLLHLAGYGLIFFLTVLAMRAKNTEARKKRQSRRSVNLFAHLCLVVAAGFGVGAFLSRQEDKGKVPPAKEVVRPANVQLKIGPPKPRKKAGN